MFVECPLKSVGAGLQTAPTQAGLESRLYATTLASLGCRQPTPRLYSNRNAAAAIKVGITPRRTAGQG